MTPLSNQAIVDLLEAEMRHDLDAYTKPGNVVYSITQDEILAFARKMGVPVPDSGAGAVLSPLEADRRILDHDLTFMRANLNSVNELLAARQEADDPIGYIQLRERRAQLQANISSQVARIAALDLALATD